MQAHDTARGPIGLGEPNAPISSATYTCTTVITAGGKKAVWNIHKRELKLEQHPTDGAEPQVAASEILGKDVDFIPEPCTKYINYSPSREK